jgi:hypothetical protein
VTGSIARARGVCPSPHRSVPVLGHGSRPGAEDFGLRAKAERAGRSSSRSCSTRFGVKLDLVEDVER